MTKGELLHFLQPFEDDIQIVVLGHDSQLDAMFMPPLPRYEMATPANDYATVTHESIGLTNGDGFVVLWVDR